MLSSIWTIERRLWPQAASRYVFLAAAFDEVGRALFPEWTGDEAWAVAEDAPEGDGAAERRLAVVDMIGNHGRNSTFDTFGLALPGGDYLVPLGSGVWNRANDWELFANCTVHQILVPRVLETDYYIFLNRDGLSRAIDLEQRRRKLEANPELALERMITRAPEPPRHRARGIGSYSPPASAPPTAQLGKKMLDAVMANREKATDATTRHDWRDKAKVIWDANPRWTTNRVAKAIAEEDGAAEVSSIARSLTTGGIVPATSPSFKQK